MASEHGFLVGPTTGAQLGVWGGRLSFTTAGAVNSNQTAQITDANFTSKIIRANNHIIITAVNGTARTLGTAQNNLSGSTQLFQPAARMSNNATIFIDYTNPQTAGETASFQFLVFGGGTNT